MQTLLALAALALGGAGEPPPAPLPEFLPLLPAAEPVAVSAPSPQAAGFSDWPDYSGIRVAFEIGQRDYTDGAWGGADNATALGFTFTQTQPGWLVGWDAGLFWSNEKGNYQGLQVQTHTGEGYAGVMKALHLIPNRLQLELGAGAALQYVYANADDQHYDDDWTASGYGRVALLLRVGGTALVGLAYRGNFWGNAQIYGTDLSTDYNQLTFMLGSSL